jgi:acyl-CoA reductase-like NAD-dependent aldehyde dehydrogenase
MSAVAPEQAAAEARADLLLRRARWAADEFRAYPPERVRRIAAAVADAGHRNAARYASWAVEETGFGVVEHKVVKNERCSRGVLEHYGAQDFASARIDDQRKLVELPRPAGVVVALTPSTNPVSTVYYKIMIAMLTRNAVVISPHPAARASCADAARTLAEAAVAAGAPDGVVQVVDEPSIPLVQALITHPGCDLVVATGGTPMVRAAYRSGNPALGVGPGNVPVLVDATADVDAAAARIVESKAFDNSLLCTSESVLLAEQPIADRLLRALQAAGGHVCDPGQRDLLSSWLYPEGRLRIEAIGRDAGWIAAQAGFRVAAGTRVLVAEFDRAVDEEPLTHEKLCPVLGFHRVPDVARGIGLARQLLRWGGRGHSAVVHSDDPRTVMAFSAAVEAMRIVVNVGGSLGSSGFETHLPPTMTIGTGFVGGSALEGNLEPRHLVQWTRVAYNADAGVPFPGFGELQPWTAESGEPPVAAAAQPAADGDLAALRHEIRELVLSELRTALAARRG